MASVQKEQWHYRCTECGRQLAVESKKPRNARHRSTACNGRLKQIGHTKLVVAKVEIAVKRL
jgi:DNA-directed RNA polymerase subunit RPC12/RpoP